MKPRVLVVLLALGSCAPGPLEVRPGLRAASGFVDRGVLQYGEPALVGDLEVRAPDGLGGRTRATARGHLPLSGHVGNGAYDEVTAGELARWELGVAWAHDLGPGELELSALRLGQPDDPSVRRRTTEVAVAYAVRGCPLHPRFAFGWDVDAVRDHFASAETHHPLGAGEDWTVDLYGRVGWFSDGLADAYLGERSAGFSDVVLGPRFERRFAGGLRVTGDLLLHRPVEEAYRVALRARDEPPGWIVLGLGVAWRR